jgi:hypothetical protein
MALGEGAFFAESLIHGSRDQALGEGVVPTPNGGTVP